jgi:hypothetical protein
MSDGGPHGQLRVLLSGLRHFVDAFETLLCIDGLVRSKEVLSFGGPLEDSLLRNFEEGGAGGGVLITERPIKRLSAGIDPGKAAW